MKEFIDKILPHIKTALKNKRIVMLLGGLFVLIIISFFFSSSEVKKDVNLDPQNEVSSKADVPAIHDTAAGDTTAETVRMLTETVHKTKNEFEAQTKTLQEEIKNLKENASKKPEEEQKKNEEFEQRIKELENKSAALPQSPGQENTGINAYPVNSSQHSINVTANSDEIVVSDERWSGGRNSPKALSVAVSTEAGLPPSFSEEEKKDIKPIPKYTLPVGATLSKAVTMSPLIGRIPIKGTVVSPYTFKALIGNENLAANGITISGLEGIVVTGKVTGDMLLSCNRAEVHTVTYVFKDCRISTSRSSGNNEAIGELSTPRGNPCIPGEFKTNAAQFLAAMGLLAAGEGASTAYAESQVRETQFPNGGIGRSVVGSPAKFILGNAGRQVSVEVKQWFLDRQQSSFDAVITQSNQEVVINISKQVEIDYDPDGRKTDYSFKGRTDLHYVASTLD